jgi:ABC-type oligopeptide transport system substrate-binding subunit/class 3 adenylate cyclase
MDERLKLQQAIAHLEAQRDTLGDEVVDSALAPLREELGRLEARADFPAQQRKQVTILFTDIVDSTKISQHLDPEDTRDIFDVALQRLGQPIDQHGGHVTRFMGDGFKAVFGTPQAHENDPEQAIRAGLGILNIAQELASELHEQWRIQDFQVRVGINTGIVAVGGATEAEDTLMGAPVNLAARMESAAPPGGLLISHHTYRHVRGVFDVQLLEPITAKGFDQPVQVYQVLRTKTRPLPIPVRGVEGIETCMVGRDVELKLLQDTLHIADREGVGQVITISGEAGIGKSRLAYEFDNWIELLPPPPIRIFQGRGRQETQHQPYALLRDVFSHRFEIQDSDPNEIVLQKIESGFAETFGTDQTGQMCAHFIGQLLGYDFSHSPYLEGVLEDPQRLRDQASVFLIDYFRTLTEKVTAVTYLEDFHWVDESSLNLVDQLGTITQGQRLLIICVTRPVLFERRPSWGEDQKNHTLLELQSLSKLQSRQLVDEILVKVDQIPDALRELVVSSAEGNPFYIEELIKMLIENGAIIKGEERWWVEATQLLRINIPSTLTGVLQSRLDSLPLDERIVLQQASVVGRKFWDRSVISINATQESGLNEEKILNSLSRLREKEIVFQCEGTTFTGTREFEFKHAMLRDVTYESVVKKSRLTYHGSVANWLVVESGNRVAEFAALIAEHLEMAERKDLAVGYLLKAGDQARQLYALDEAERLYKGAVEILREQGDDKLTARTLMNLGLVYLAYFQPDKASQAYDEAFAFGTQLDLPSNLPDLRLDPAVLHFAIEQPVTLDPGQIEDDASTFLAVQLFEGLVRVGMDSNVLPAVAARWEVDQGGKRYIFHLRDDALWNDGMPVSAHDFEYAWKRNLHPTSGSQSAHLLYPIRNAKAFREGHLADSNQIGVHAINDKRLEILLEGPTAYLPYLLAHPVTFPVPKNFIEDHNRAWMEAGKFLTNGAYQLTEWDKDQKMVLVKNPHYFGFFPGNTERIECVVYPDYEQALMAYAQGEVDAVSMINADPAIVAQAQVSYPDELVSLPIPTIFYLNFRTDEPPFNDLRVRQAFVHAVDRQSLVEKVFQNQRLPAVGGFIPPGLPAHSPEIGLAFDPHQAQQLLNQAGFASGKGFPQVILIHGIGGEKVIQFLRTSWQDYLGISIQTESLPGDELFDRLAQNPAHLSLTGWSADYPDPDNMLRVTFHSREGINDIRWQNPSFDPLIEEACQVTDHLQRMELYRQADRILVADEAVVMPLTYGQRRMLAKNHIELPRMPHFQILFKHIRIRKEEN